MTISRPTTEKANDDTRGSRYSDDDLTDGPSSAAAAARVTTASSIKTAAGASSPTIDYLSASEGASAWFSGVFDFVVVGG